MLFSSSLLCMYVRIYVLSYEYTCVHLYTYEFECVYEGKIHEMYEGILCDMTHPCVWHDTFKYVSWRIYMCDMTCSFVCVSGYIRQHVQGFLLWCDPSLCVTWPIHVCDMTHACLWHDPFMCLTWAIHVCDMTHPCVWVDTFKYVLWNIYVCGMMPSFRCVSDSDTQHVRGHPLWCDSRMWHDTFIRVTWRIHMCNMTQLFAWHDSFIYV